MIHAQALESTHLDNLKSRVAAAETAFDAIAPLQDQNMFIDHNIRSFSAPPDFVFEPCGIYYDTVRHHSVDEMDYESQFQFAQSEMSIEPAPKVYLQNRLSRCRQKLEELNPVLRSKQLEVEKLANLASAYAQDHGLGNADEVAEVSGLDI